MTNSKHKALYTDILDYTETRLNDSLYGYPDNHVFKINSYLSNFAMLHNRNSATKNKVKARSKHNKVSDYALVDSEAVRKTKLFHDALFTDQLTRRRLFNRGNSLEKSRKSCSLFYYVLTNKGFSTLDRINALGDLSNTANSTATFDTRLAPFDSFSGAIIPFSKIDLTLDSFKGFEILKTKQTLYTDLTHTFEPLVLLEGVINSIEDGLFSKLENSINRMLQSETYEEFYKEALLYLGYIEPHQYVLNEKSSDKEEVYDLTDEFGDPLHNDNFQIADTLLNKYKLHCHCGSDSNNWKVRAIPTIVEYTFYMKAK